MNEARPRSSTASASPSCRRASTGREPKSSRIGNRWAPRRTKTPLWPDRIVATKADCRSVRFPTFTSTETPRLVCRGEYAVSGTGLPETRSVHAIDSSELPLFAGTSVSALRIYETFIFFRFRMRFDASERMSRRAVDPALRIAARSFPFVFARATCAFRQSAVTFNSTCRRVTQLPKERGSRRRRRGSTYRFMGWAEGRRRRPNSQVAPYHLLNLIEKSRYQRQTLGPRITVVRCVSCGWAIVEHETRQHETRCVAVVEQPSALPALTLSVVAAARRNRRRR